MASGDWIEIASNVDLKLCSLAAQGLCLQMLVHCARHAGYLQTSGVSMSIGELAILVGHAVEEIQPLLDELLSRKIFHRDDRGVFHPAMAQANLQSLSHLNGHASLPVPRKPGIIRTTLPPDWSPSVEQRATAQKFGLSDKEADLLSTKFMGYYTSGKGAGTQTTERRWNQRWQNWCAREAERTDRPRTRDDPNRAFYYTDGVFNPQKYREYKQLLKARQSHDD